ncbi:MAG: hypothetical protein EBU23_08110 [Mycobacteriaceae bacterium]|nr:hypothetical protein [Mycobacteriaceae bacterium]
MTIDDGNAHHIRTNPSIKDVFVFSPDKDPYIAQQNNADGFQENPANGQPMLIGSDAQNVPIAIHLLDDTPSLQLAVADAGRAPPPDAAPLPEAPDFHDHRHDQAIWSLLARQHGALLLPDEMWPPGGPDTGPIVAARRR